MLHKVYRANPEGESRYSPAKCICTTSAIISGHPNPKHISTSYVERQNLTMRMSIRRFTRLNAFSKELENHASMVAIYFMYYNFARIHQTLRVTPAMELASRIMSGRLRKSLHSWLRHNAIVFGIALGAVIAIAIRIVLSFFPALNNSDSVFIGSWGAAFFIWMAAYYWRTDGRAALGAALISVVAITSLVEDLLFPGLPSSLLTARTFLRLARIPVIAVGLLILLPALRSKKPK